MSEMSVNPLFFHRSVRQYEEREVADDTLEHIFRSMQRGSNTGNMQLYSVVLTTDAATKAALSPAHCGQPMVMQAPLVATFCADVARFMHWAALSNADSEAFYNFEMWQSAAIDATIAAERFALQAEHEGLGICYLGTTIYNPQMIINVLELPRGVMPVCTLTVGYPKQEPELQTRLPIGAIVHRDKYHTPADGEVEGFYAETVANPDNQAFVAENNKNSLAAVFTEVRYPRQGNELYSQRLLEALRRQGFLNPLIPNP